MAKVRKYTRKAYSSDKEKHFSQSKHPQIGLGNIPGVDLQRFFSYVRFDSHGQRGKWLRKMDEADRNVRFNHWIREIKDEFGFPSIEALQVFLGVSGTTMKRMAYRNTRPVSLGFVLDLAYIFQKDPAEIFPELLWLRDIWMQDFATMIDAAKIACEAGELAAVRDCLEAMAYTTSMYPFDSSEDLGLNVLLQTKAEITETQAYLKETLDIRLKFDGQWHNKVHFDSIMTKRITDKFLQLRQEFDEVQKHNKGRVNQASTEAAD